MEGTLWSVVSETVLLARGTLVVLVGSVDVVVFGCSLAFGKETGVGAAGLVPWVLSIGLGSATDLRALGDASVAMHSQSCSELNNQLTLSAKSSTHAHRQMLNTW